MDWHPDPDQLLLADPHARHLEANSTSYDATKDAEKNGEKTLLIFLGGAMDDVYQPMLQGVFIPYRLKYDGHHDCCYATHAATKHIIQLIKYWHSNGQKICLLGHSWGGKNIHVIANKLIVEKIPIALLVTLDPVSRRYFRRHIKKPANVKKWVNVHVDYGKASMEYSNVIARLGGYWGHCQHADRNIRLSRDNDSEITHAMAGRMFAEVEEDVIML